MPNKTIHPHDLRSNGDRLGDLRRAAGWKQQRLATESGYSLSTIKKYEQNQRPLDRGQVILALATALGVHPAAITGHPFHSGEDQEAAAASAVVNAVHRALLVHGRPARITDAEADAVDLAALQARVRQTIDYRHTSALAKTAEVLPELLRALQIAALICEGDERRRAYGLLADAYESAMQFTYKLGHNAVATLATERVLCSAHETGDPLRVLAARWFEAGEFISIGENHVAADVIDESLLDLARLERTPQQLALTGAMHLKAALNAARAADANESEERLQHAQRAADELGEDRNDFELQFGPMNVAIWSVALPVEFGRGREAIRRGEHITPPAYYAPERVCHLRIDMGRAYWQNGDRESALLAFLEAEHIAPQETRMNSAVRETLRSMKRQQPRGRLAELCLRVGVV